MKHFLYLSISAIFIFSSQGFAAGEGQSPVLQAINSEISKSGLSKKYFGLWVKGEQLLADVNGGKLFVPASLSKVPTALSVLSRFPVNHKFKTWIYKTGKVENGTLKGDLYLKGGGDPSFVSESLWLMIQKLKREEISKIDGNIYFDDSYFDRDLFSTGRQTTRVDRAYDAPVSALSFNWNSIAIFVRPGKKAGDKGKVFVDPAVDYIQVENHSKTVGARGQTRLQVSRVTLEDGVKIIVSGTISTSKDEKAFYKSITRPSLWTAINFLHQLKVSGVEYSGKVSPKKTPASADKLVEFESWEMSRIIAALSKFSNNFVAEMLAKHLGKEERKPAKIDAGVAKIVSYLAANGWKKGEFQFVNPSGFTRGNKMRPDRLGELLRNSEQMFRLAPEFLSALPISGIDGTLKDRMQPMKGLVRAKTGYLTGVVGLAGFLQSPKGGDPVTFAFIYNGPAKHDWKVRAMFDKMVYRIGKAI